MAKKTLIFVLALLIFVGVKAQLSTASDSLSRWDFHVKLGTGVYSGFDQVHGYTSVAPRVTYKPNDKLKLHGGFVAFNEMEAATLQVRGHAPRNMAPRKNSSMAIAAYIAGTYRVNDRLLLAGSLFHLGGQIDPLWTPSQYPVDLSVTGFNAAMSYRLGKSSYLDVSLTVLRDRTGAVVPLLMNPFYMGANPWGYWNDLHGGNCFVGSPFWCY